MYYYQPFQNISIDESLAGSKSRNPVHQYLPNKYHTRFGTKIRMFVCSKTSYVLKLYVYEGARFDKSSGFGQVCYCSVNGDDRYIQLWIPSIYQQPLWIPSIYKQLKCSRFPFT